VRTYCDVIIKTTPTCTELLDHVIVIWP